jgi:exodeoxyribonuclease V alpha subunit
MVDLGLMHQLVDAMPPGCRLLLVGDEFQLPPVGFGLVFHHLVAQEAITARLEAIRRQEGDTGIPQIAQAIRHGRKPILPQYRPGYGGVSFLQAVEGRISEAIEWVARDLGGLGNPQDLMVLAPVNRRHSRPDGTVRDINRRFHLRKLGDRDLTEEELGTCTVRGYLGNSFSVGDPVVFLRNDYDTDLRNGSVGVTTAVDVKAGTVTCEFDGRRIDFANRDLIDLALGYALTCHRAQGSQARTVIVSLIEAANVDPSWIYTAITRAEERVILVGQWSVFERALAQTPAFKRRVTGCRFELDPPQ